MIVDSLADSSVRFVPTRLSSVTDIAGLNSLLRPILVLLTLPVTLLTLGLFLFVINALMFYFAASILDGFQVTGFVAALIGYVTKLLAVSRRLGAIAFSASRPPSCFSPG